MVCSTVTIIIIIIAHSFIHLTISSHVLDWTLLGLYDCFPICLILAMEATGLAPYNRGGAYIESLYHKYIANNCHISATDLPINTHGGKQFTYIYMYIIFILYMFIYVCYIFMLYMYA